MPETAHHMNGYANGHAPPELQQDTTFLFTSESVGEGHPGERSPAPYLTAANPFPGGPSELVTLHYISVKAFSISSRPSLSLSLCPYLSLSLWTPQLPPCRVYNAAIEDKITFATRVCMAASRVLSLYSTCICPTLSFALNDLFTLIAIIRLTLLHLSILAFGQVTLIFLLGRDGRPGLCSRKRQSVPLACARARDR